MARPKAPATRIICIEDRGGDGASRWRVKYVDNGNPFARCFAERALADKFARQFTREKGIEAGPTVEGVYELFQAQRKVRDTDARVAAVQRILGDVWCDPIGRVTTEDIRAGYLVESKRKRNDKNGRIRTDQPIAVATHQSALERTKTFFAWARRHGHVKVDPAIDVQKVGGKPNAGKPQIGSMTELNRFMDVAWRHAREGNVNALGILLALYLGPRSGEVRAIEARHVDRDDPGRVFLPGTKNENARRAVRIQTPALWDLLVKRADSIAPTDRIVPRAKSIMPKWVKKIAREAGVSNAEELCFHSLRGQAGSLATKGDAATAAIAALLGHGSIDVTNEHYIAPTAQADAATRATAAVLDRDLKPDNIATLAARIAALQAELAALSAPQ